MNDSTAAVPGGAGSGLAVPASIAAAVFFGHLLLGSNYITFDALSMITPLEPANPAHFGYQFLMHSLARIFRLIDPEALTLYDFLMAAQIALCAAGFGLAARFLLRLAEGKGMEERRFAAAVVLLLAFCGASARFVSLLEAYIPASLLIIAGIGLAEREEGGPFSRLAAPALLWLAAMSLESVCAINCGPLFILVALRSIKERRLKQLVLAAAASALWVIAFGWTWHATPTHYQNLNNGGHALNAENLGVFAFNSGRLLVYIISPSLPLIAYLPAKILAAAAAAAGALVIAAIVVTAAADAWRRGSHRGLVLAVSAGIIARGLFSIWWMPENTEQSINGLFIGVFAAALTVLDRPVPAAGPWLTRTAAVAAALITAANVLLVLAPAHRAKLPYLDVVRETTLRFRDTNGNPPVMLTDDTNLGYFNFCRDILLEKKEREGFPKAEIVYLNTGFERNYSARQLQKYESHVLDIVGRFFQSGRVVLFMTSAPGLEARFGKDGTPNNKVDPRSYAYLENMKLPLILHRHYRLTRRDEIEGYGVWAVSPRPDPENH